MYQLHCDLCDRHIEPGGILLEVSTEGHKYIKPNEYEFDYNFLSRNMVLCYSCGKRLDNFFKLKHEDPINRP